MKVYRHMKGKGAICSKQRKIEMGGEEAGKKDQKGLRQKCWFKLKKGGPGKGERTDAERRRGRMGKGTVKRGIETGEKELPDEGDERPIV